MEELRGIILTSQQEIESLHEQQEEVLQQLEASLAASGVRVPENGSSSTRDRVAALVAALKKAISSQQHQEFEACVRLLIERVAASTYERQLKREREKSKQAAAAASKMAAAAAAAAAGAATAADPSQPADASLLQHQLAVSQAENAALRAQLEAGGGDAGGLDVSDLTGEQLQQAAGFRSLQERAEELTAQVQALKDENDQKKLKEAEAKSRGGGGAANDAQVKAMELKLKEAEAEKRRELKQLEQELTKNTKGAAADVKKLEAQLQKQTERADKAESELDTTKSDYRDLQKKYDAIQKEITELQKQVGDVQAMHAELQQLRSTSSQQAAQIKELEASYQAEKKLRKKYYNEIEDMKGKIRVFCRVRPFAKYEMEKGCKECVSVVDEYSIKVSAPKARRTPS
ncbi:hypothetical protein ACSSS7_008296 [Eimeria intestinalis]